MASFTVAASLGIAGGAYISRFVQAKQLQKAFGYFLLAMSAFILWQNRGAFRRMPQTGIASLQQHSVHQGEDK